jgi:ABC-2 type transport system permease protein
MRKVYVVARREYLAAVRTKAFLIGLLVMPLLMSGSLIMQRLIGDFRDTRDKRFAVVDRTPGQRVLPALGAAVEQYNEKQTVDPATGRQVKPRFGLEAVPPGDADTQREQLSERVRKGELTGFLEVGPHVAEPAPPAAGDPADEARALRYQTNRPTVIDFPRLAEQVVSAAVAAQRAGQAGVPLAKAQEVLRPVPLVSKGLSVRNPATGKLEDGGDQGRFAPLIVPGALMILMFMVVVMGATPLMQGVVEEKMQRIAEVLLGSVRPFELMLGKLIGMAGVALTMSAVYLGGAYWAAHHYGFAEYLGPGLLAWFVTYQVLATLLFGSLFTAVGAACTDMKETQTLMWPVMLMAMLPLFVLGSVLQEPNGPVATALSFFPPATPMLMIARQAVPPGPPAWQPALGVALVLLTTLAAVYAAGRIFRVGMLVQGKGASLGDMLRWVIRG